MTHVLTLKFKGGETEVHMLNPGEHFERFGGSSGGLVVGKTASLITRTKTVGHSDVERDIYDRDFWQWIGELINSGDGEVTAEWTGNTKEKK